MAVICGADGWAQAALFDHCKRKWLATFLELPGTFTVTTSIRLRSENAGIMPKRLNARWDYDYLLKFIAA